MNQEKIGEFIKKLRQDNNLTQKDLANKYNVTYQAVSKWERGLNIPDISLLKQMSEDFNKFKKLVSPYIQKWALYKLGGS